MKKSLTLLALVACPALADAPATDAPVCPVTCEEPMFSFEPGPFSPFPHEPRCTMTQICSYFSWDAAESECKFVERRTISWPMSCRDVPPL